MPTTFTAIGVVALAILPGALYVWGFERVVGPWGVKLTDRLMRFFGVSAIGHVLLLPVTAWLWRTFILSGKFASGEVPLHVWGVAIAYVFGPLLIGSLIGRATVADAGWAAWFTGPDPAPRAWDYVFGLRPQGWIRLKLKSGIWIGGAYARRRDGRRSYAAGYPEPQDLFLVKAAEMNPGTGEFIKGPDGSVRLRDSGILIRWEEVEFMEFIGV